MPAYGLERPGLVERFDVQTGGYEFEVSATSNFSIKSHEFDADEKRITLFLESGVENNLSEISIPENLIGGNFTFYLDDEEIFPRVLAGQDSAFIIVEFAGPGDHRLDIIGTTYLPEFAEIAMLVLATSMFAIIIKGRALKKLFVN